MPKLSKFKVVLVGDQNVGKTSIISRFIHDSFELTSNPTVGIDFVTKTLQIQGETLRLQLWDTAGQERFRALIPSYVRDADVCLIVIDLGIKATLDGVNRWLDFVRQSRGQDALIFIVGNKSDLTDREVTKEEAEDYSERNAYPYMQVSAKNGNNIHNLFRKLSQRLIEGKNGPVKDISRKNSIDGEKSSKIKKQEKNVDISKKKLQGDAKEKKKACEC